MTMEATHNKTLYLTSASAHEMALCEHIQVNMVCCRYKQKCEHNNNDVKAVCVPFAYRWSMYFRTGKWAIAFHSVSLLLFLCISIHSIPYSSFLFFFSIFIIIIICSSSPWPWSVCVCALTVYIYSLLCSRVRKIASRLSTMKICVNMIRDQINFLRTLQAPVNIWCVCVSLRCISIRHGLYEIRQRVRLPILGYSAVPVHPWPQDKSNDKRWKKNENLDGKMRPSTTITMARPCPAHIVFRF